MSVFDDFFSEILNGVKGLATGELKNFATAAKSDAQAFLETSKENLRRRTRLLADGQLTKEEFEDLLAGDAEVAQMFALTQAGISAARIQRFRDGLINLVIDTAFKKFLP